MASVIPSPGQATYAAAKAGLNQYLATLSTELRHRCAAGLARATQRRYSCMTQRGLDEMRGLHVGACRALAWEQLRVGRVTW